MTKNYVEQTNITKKVSHTKHKENRAKRRIGDNGCKCTNVKWLFYMQTLN